MGYLALYRKYRPKNFDEVVGQDEVAQILKNQILSDRIGHAYLLTGIRGTGKTSIAKIFAKAVNCRSGSNGNPCNQCEVCLNIDKPGLMDIIEIDAASNRGVDEIRDIRDKVIYPPKIGRYKVYIIDEVHMLTKEAFNALLKTLEEPPAHIIFILATTEPNKLPATILSRCQRFDIRPISQEMIAGQISLILKDIKVEMNDEAIQLIAARGDHSMRDALSILDQAIDLRKGEEKITAEAVMRFLGMTEKATIIALIEALLTNDAVKVIEILSSLKQKGTDSIQLTAQIIDLLRQIIIVKMIGHEAQNILEIGRKEIEPLKQLADRAASKRLYQIIEALIEDRQKMRFHDCPEIILEMALLKQCGESGENLPEQKTSLHRDSPLQVINNTLTSKSINGAVENQPTMQVEEKAIQSAPYNEKTEQVRETGKPQPTNRQEDQKVEKEPADVVLLNENDTTDFDQMQADQQEKGNGLTGSEDIDSIRQTIAAWGENQDFFTAQILAFGYLKSTAPGKYVMVFQAPEHNMYAEMFGGRIQKQVEEIISKALGKAIHLTVECSTKNYEDMDFEEKTAAIVGEEYKEKIKVTN